MTSLINELPIEVFRLIHSWSSNEDYRSFMNAGFRDVKYETIFLNLTFQFQMIESIQQRIDYFCLKVRDSKKQIGLTLISFPPDSIVELSPNFQRVNSVCVTEKCVRFRKDANGDYFLLEPAPDFSTFDFSIFNNVPRVSLRGIQTVRRILSGLENVQYLELARCTLLEELHFTNSRLEHLSLYSCHSLRVLFPDVQAVQDNIPRANVCNRLTSFEYYCDSESINCQEWDESYFRNLQLFRFEGTFLSLPPAEILSNIVHLVFFHHGTPYPLPVLRGVVRLWLRGFDLSQWSGAVLENVCELELDNCTNLNTLMTMPRVKIVVLLNVPSVSLEQELPACFLFHLEGMDTVTLPRLPRLTHLVLLKCDNLVNLALPSDHVLEVVRIESCHSLTAIESLKNSRLLGIIDCNAITSFRGFDEGIIVPDRSIALAKLSKETDYTGLSRLRSLTILSGTEMIVSNMYDIDELEIRNFSRATIKNIGNNGVKCIRSVNISYVGHLTVNDVYDIEQLEIAHCSKLVIKNIGYGVLVNVEV